MNTAAYRPPQYAYTTAPTAPYMVGGAPTTVTTPVVMHGGGAHANVDGVYVTENYVGPVSTILGCVLLGPFLCPLVFFCPVRDAMRFFLRATRDLDAGDGGRTTRRRDD